jgi:hypothetical protein
VARLFRQAEQNENYRFGEGLLVFALLGDMSHNYMLEKPWSLVNNHATLFFKEDFKRLPLDGLYDFLTNFPPP